MCSAPRSSSLRVGFFDFFLFRFGRNHSTYYKEKNTILLHDTYLLLIEPINKDGQQYLEFKSEDEIIIAIPYDNFFSFIKANIDDDSIDEIIINDSKRDMKFEVINFYISNNKLKWYFESVHEKILIKIGLYDWYCARIKRRAAGRGFNAATMAAFLTIIYLFVLLIIYLIKKISKRKNRKILKENTE